MQPKVSVIVPIYNVEQYLHKCLDSLVNQTLKDIEIICINDCSPDNSLITLKKYAKKDNRIAVINLKRNQGVSAARNAGMKIAKGEYIGFCDPDDYVDLDFYEKLHDKAKKTNADMVKASLKKKKVEWVKEYSYFARIEKNKYYNIFYHCCYIYKTDFLKKNKINYPEDIKFSEDALLLIKSLFYSNRIEAVDNTFYHYIMRECDAATSYIGDAIVNSFGLPMIFDFMNKVAKDENEYKLFFNVLFVNNVLNFFTRVAPEYRKFFVGIAVDIYKNRRYPIIPEEIPNFLKECDLENVDILFEKLNNNLNYLQYPKIQIDNLQNRNLYIWGAGKDGFGALIQCDCNGWKVEAFLDSNSQIKEYHGYRVLLPQDLLDSKSRDFFIVISSKAYAGEIAEICERAGLRESRDFWKPG